MEGARAGNQAHCEEKYTHGKAQPHHQKNQSACQPHRSQEDAANAWRLSLFGGSL
jgi:hypothetical protein